MFLSIQRPPISTRTDTLFPYTTRFRSKQIINVLLLNAMAAQFHFDAGDIADEAASGEVDPLILDISACDPFGLLDRFAHCLLGTFHVRDIAAPHTSAFALACAKDREFAPVGLPRNQGGHFPGPYIEDRKSTRLNSSH